MKLRTAFILVVAASLAACAKQPAALNGDVPGFLQGLFNGFTIIFAFVASFFTDIRIYAFPNSGWTYDAGFVLGVILFCGGGSASAR